MFSTAVGILPGEVVHVASTSSGTYYGINWTLDANGNLTLQSGTSFDLPPSDPNYTGIARGNI